MPREKDNWNSKAVNAERKYTTNESWRDVDGKPMHPHTNYYVGGNTKFYGAALFRLRAEDFGEIKHRGGISPAWPVSYDDMEPHYAAADQLYHVYGNVGEDPTEPWHSGPMSFREDRTKPAREKVLFGAGCFWGVEADFAKVKGVTNTRVGYSGGVTKNPSYEDVCSHTTGHAEVVEVEYDPAQLSFTALLDVFWENHDPTAGHLQGPDIGSQYRSAIFFTTPEQEATARASAARLEKNGKLSRPITTEIALAPPFYAAEECHQKYYAKHAGGSCRIP